MDSEIAQRIKDRDTRAVEARLFQRIREGDATAKWELFARQERLIDWSARIYAKGDSLLEEELRAIAGDALESAYEVYDSERARKHTYAYYAYRYLGRLFGITVRNRKVAVGAALGAAESGLYESSTPAVDEEWEEKLPFFFNEETQEIARLLSEGFKLREARVMMGMTSTEFNRKVKIIQNRLRREGRLDGYEFAGQDSDGDNG